MNISYDNSYADYDPLAAAEYAAAQGDPEAQQAGLFDLCVHPKVAK